LTTQTITDSYNRRLQDLSFNHKGPPKTVSRKINKSHLIWINVAFTIVMLTFVTSVNVKGIPFQGRPINNEWTRCSAPNRV